MSGINKCKEDYVIRNRYDLKKVMTVMLQIGKKLMKIEGIFYFNLAHTNYSSECDIP